MNIYEISTSAWRTRVKAASFRAAIRRGLANLADKIPIDERYGVSLHVKAVVLQRDIPLDTRIPPPEEWD